MEFELTPEEREILRQVNEARDRKDNETYYRLARKIPLEPAIAKAEETARKNRVGLWTQNNPVPLWDFRHNQPKD